MKKVLCAALMALCATSAQPQATEKYDGSPIRLYPDAAATIDLGADGHAILAGGRAAPLTASERNMIQNLIANHADAVGPNGVRVQGKEPLPEIKPGRIRFTLVPFGNGKASVLVVQNGTAQPFLYKALISRGGKQMVTDVCQTIPMKHSFEHWPYPIEWIQISDIRKIEWKEGDRLRCE